MTRYDDLRATWLALIDGVTAARLSRAMPRRRTSAPASVAWAASVSELES